MIAITLDVINSSYEPLIKKKHIKKIVEGIQGSSEKDFIWEI